MKSHIKSKSDVGCIMLRCCNLFLYCNVCYGLS